MALPIPVPTFVLQHPKIYKSYLHESPPSVLSATDFSLTNHDKDVQPQESDTETHKKRVVEGEGLSSPYWKSHAENLFHSQLCKTFLKITSKSLYGIHGNRQTGISYLGVASNSAVDIAEESTEKFDPVHCDGHDIIICIRDETKPLSESLVRAYAINAEFLCSTMTYFKDMLSTKTCCEETVPIQISLFLPKILWDWLLNFAKFHLREHQEKQPAIEPKLALSLFAASVIMGMQPAKKVILEYILSNWPAVLQHRDRKMDYLVEKAIGAFAQHLSPAFVEDLSAENDCLIENLYREWNAMLLNEDETQIILRNYFPYGNASNMFICVYCRRWMNPEISSYIDCDVSFVFRRANGTVGYLHAKHPDSHLLGNIHETNENCVANKQETLFWKLYGTLNLLHCAKCNKQSQLVDLDVRIERHDTLTAGTCPNVCCRNGCGETEFPCQETRKITLARTDVLRRIVRFGRFFTSGPVDSGILDDSSALPTGARAAIQDLVGVAWEANRPLWSKQDCMRIEERMSMRYLKTYLKEFTKVHPTELTQGTGESEPIDQSDDLTSKPNDRSHACQPDEQDAQGIVLDTVNSSDAVKGKGGPFAARLRYIPNLVLPEYKGLYTRLYHNWKMKADAAIEAENVEQERILEQNALNESIGRKRKYKQKMNYPRKPKVQRIALRKVNSKKSSQKSSGQQFKTCERQSKRKSVRSVTSIAKSKSGVATNGTSKVWTRSDRFKQADNQSAGSNKSKRKLPAVTRFGYHISDSSSNISVLDHFGAPVVSSSSTDFQSLQQLLRYSSAKSGRKTACQGSGILNRLRVKPSLLAEFADKILRITIRPNTKQNAADRDKSPVRHQPQDDIIRNEVFDSRTTETSESSRLSSDRVDFDICLSKKVNHELGIRKLLRHLDNHPLLTADKKPWNGCIPRPYTATFITTKSLDQVLENNHSDCESLKGSSKLLSYSSGWCDIGLSNSLLDILENGSAPTLQQSEKFLLNLIRQIPFPTLAKNCSDPIVASRNRTLLEEFLTGVENFFRRAVNSREKMFSRMFRSFRLIQRNSENSSIGDIATNTSFRKRLLRVIAVLEGKRWDAFTQPVDRNRGFMQLQKMRVVCNKQITVTVTAWENRTEKLHKMLFFDSV